MTGELDRNLHRILRLRTGPVDTLHNRESTSIEFKQAFGLASLPRYVRTMIAFANNRGGYIVYGVEPSPHVVRGVNPAFAQMDSAQISTFLREHVSPEIKWEAGSIQFHGKELGYIYTYENRDKPVMVSKQNGEYLSDAAIYYRYNGQSCSIRYPELRALVDARLGAERNAWMEHLRNISRAGPANVGIIDTVHGTLHGAGGTYLIEEPLIRQLKLIREGSFVDTGGDPALRLVGEVQAVGGVVAERPIRSGIHADDLLTAFLAQRPLEQSEARPYLRETAYQNSFLFPVFYFVRLAGMTQNDASALIEAQSVPFSETKKRLARRIKGEESIGRLGAPPRKPKLVRIKSVEDIAAALQATRNASEARYLVRELIIRYPEHLQRIAQQLSIFRVCEAISHLNQEQIQAAHSSILDMLLQQYNSRYDGLDSNEKSIFRRCICYLDQELFKDAKQGN